MPLIAVHWTTHNWQLKPKKNQKKKNESGGRSLNTKESPLRLGIDQIKCRSDRLKLRQYIYLFFSFKFSPFSPGSSLIMQEEGGAHIARILRPYQVTRE